MKSGRKKRIGVKTFSQCRTSGGGFLKLKRGEFTDWLMRCDPNAFLLLTLIAIRARYTRGSTLDGLVYGQAFIGDYESCGLTPTSYRTAKDRLEQKYGLASFEGESTGTVATLRDSRVFELGDLREDAKNGERKDEVISEVKLEKVTDSLTSKGQTEGERGASNQKDRREAARKYSSGGLGDSDEIVRPPASESENFVDWFLALLAETGAPKLDMSTATRIKWARCFEDMVKIDNRTKNQVEEVCRWARNDTFWRGIFLSPERLRRTKDGVMLFDDFLNRMGGDPAKKPYDAAARPSDEPPGWQAFVDRRMPGCAYAVGNKEHGCSWASVSAERKQFIIEEMKKYGNGITTSS